MDTDHVPLYFDEPFREFHANTIESHQDRSCLEQIELALLYENKPAFVELIDNLPSHLLDEDLYLILVTIFAWDSSKCAAAILDGQTKIAEIPFATSFLSQLHRAATYNAPKMTALLLQRGFSADVRADHGKLKNVLPPMLSGSRFYFGSIGKYRRPMETVRLIALNTKEIKREFFNYLKEGKTIEVVALLLVAKSHILSPSSAKVEGEFRSISEIHDFVLNTVSHLKTRELTKSNELLVEMERTLELLAIFDKIGDKLAAFIRLDFTQTCFANCSRLLVESLIEDAGFDVNYFYCGHSYTRSEAGSYYLKGAIDACEKTIRTSDVPIWVKEAALAGLGVKSGSNSRFTYPLLAEILSKTSIVSVSTPRSASPMLENMTPLCHLLKKTAPFVGTIKRVFRRG